MTSPIARLADNPPRAFAALVAAQVAFWTLAPALSHSAPPLDVVEMYAWGREHVVATFKHPNLPGLVLEATRIITGGMTGWPAYLVSQLFIALTLWGAYALGREMMDERRALVGTALLTGIYFFFWPTPEFNHNVAQMPFWALTSLYLWRASNNGKALDWALLGLVAGLSIWAKYSSGVLLIVAAIWMLWDANARRKWRTPGPYITAVVFALVIAPQVLWLVQHDFQPFAYAGRRASAGAWYSSLEFLLTLVADHLPMLIMIAAAGLFGKAIADAAATPERRALRYLLLMGLGPALLMAAGSAVTGSSLRSAWGTPMFAPSGLIVVALLSAKISQERAQRVLIGAFVMIVLGSTLYFAHMKYGLEFTGKPLRGNWPQAEISAQLEETWAHETNGAPLTIVAGDIWTGGLIGFHDRHPPSVLINGDYAITPWVKPEDVARSGALIVWSGDEPSTLPAFRQGLVTRDLVVRPPRVKDGPRADITVHYAILRPRPSPAP